jgi:hypothetical protein
VDEAQCAPASARCARGWARQRKRAGRWRPGNISLGGNKSTLADQDTGRKDSGKETRKGGREPVKIAHMYYAGRQHTRCGAILASRPWKAQAKGVVTQCTSGQVGI